MVFYLGQETVLHRNYSKNKYLFKNSNEFCKKCEIILKKKVNQKR